MEASVSVCGREGGCIPCGYQTGSSGRIFGGIGAAGRTFGGIGAGPYGEVGRILGGMGAGPKGKSFEDEDDDAAAVAGCPGT